MTTISFGGMIVVACMLVHGYAALFTKDQTLMDVSFYGVYVGFAIALLGLCI